MPAYVQPVTVANLIIAAQLYLGFFVALFLIAKLLPGFQRDGFPQPGGETKRYKLTGLWSFLAITAGVATAAALGLSLAPLVDYFWSLLVIANVVAAVWTVQLFISGRADPSYAPGESGPLRRWLDDLWLGPIRNPTLLGVDMKMFAYQPSLIGLWLMVATFGFKQWELHDTLTPQMVLFQLFWWVYLFTHYVREDFMLSTWDIIAENFGFMLAWGDLVYVTFFYCIGGWFLVDQTEAMATPWLIALVLLHGVGHWIFREANWQKDRYKRDPGCTIWGKPAKTLAGRLLISGWWGVGRKINYTGEIIVYLSFTLCTGLTSWIPYVLPLSLVILLVHRAHRDDKKCSAKYGADWAAYCKQARFKIFPLIY